MNPIRTMEFLDEDLERYIEQHTSDENDLLKRINRETHVEVLKPRMLSGHVQGRLLSMISKMVRPQNILEIGTYTGYSAICLAEGIREGGKLITIDVNEELEDRVLGYVEEAGFSDVIEMRIGQAESLVPELQETFDLIFIDANKAAYWDYLEMVYDKLSVGGLVIADNVLWSGKVLEKFREKLDVDTEALIEFNKKVQEDERFENVLLGIRDGLMVIRKK